MTTEARPAGSRQRERMRASIEAAFMALVREKGYEDITIGDITERANVGRSTFYRYFETKTDLLIAMHQSLFDRFNLGLRTRDEWLAESPPAALVEFLTHMRHLDTRSAPYYTLSKDLTFSRDMTLIIRRVTDLLREHIEEGLRAAFGGEALAVPLALLAQSIVGLYMGIFQWWLVSAPALTTEQAAAYLHRLVRAVVREALTAP